jgi:hypothetical protein
MQSNRQIDRSKGGSQMAAHLGNHRNNFFADFARQLRQVIDTQAANIFRGLHAID